MTVLVTGGTGFVGPKIVHALRAEERPVRALVREPEEKSARTLATWGCDLARGDMTDAESLNRAVQGCDTVVHLVALTPGSRSGFEQVMSQGTRDLVTAAREAGATRFVLMSALGVHEGSKDVSRYYRAKWEMEQEVEASRLPYTIFRPSFIFGRDGGILQALVRVARFSPVIPSVGSRRLQPIWVGDVAAYFANSLSTPQAAGRTFEIAGPDVVTWGELYDRVGRITGKRRARVHLPTGLVRGIAAVSEKLPAGPPLSREAVAMLEHEDNVADIGPAVDAFGIEPITLDEQIRRAVA
ncbi:MAG: complex I NDUFA9 subunit family protein [Actinobacteria bacterium]|nr:complex I NDUFA9 subunit family protein [Actinomycetota bacterium]